MRAIQDAVSRFVNMERNYLNLLQHYETLVSSSVFIATHTNMNCVIEIKTVIRIFGKNQRNVLPRLNLEAGLREGRPKSSTNFRKHNAITVSRECRQYNQVLYVEICYQIAAAEQKFKNANRRP